MQARRPGTCPASDLPIAVGDEIVKFAGRWQLSRATIDRKRAYLASASRQTAWNEHRDAAAEADRRTLAADNFDAAVMRGGW